MNTLEQRLKEALADAGRPGDIAGLAKVTGVSYQAASKWCDGRTKSMRSEYAHAVAEWLDVNEPWLSTGRPPKRGHAPSMLEGGNIATPPRPISAYMPEDPISEDEVEVPVLNLKLSAGRGHIQWEIDQTGRRHRYDKRWIDNLGIREPEKLTTVRVEGDSMWPGIPDSSSVVLYTGPLNLRNGEVYAIDYLNEFFIKRLYKDPDGCIRIVSDNPDKNRYADIRVAPEFADSLRILGIAVEVKRTLIGRIW